jgi:hypothetical protein
MENLKTLDTDELSSKQTPAPTTSAEDLSHLGTISPLEQGGTHHFLVAVDGSKTGDLAFERALKMAVDSDQVHVVNACPDFQAIDYVATGVVDRSRMEKDLKMSQNLLAKYAERCQAESVMKFLN